MSLPTPNTRKEQYLNAIATGNAGGLPTPITREEEYLDAIAKSGGGSGDGDMKKSVYDSDLDVAGAGGIKAFVNDAISGKVDKVEGKGLSTNDYTDEDKAIVDGVTGALAEKADTDDIPDIVSDNLAKGILGNETVLSTDTVPFVSKIMGAGKYQRKKFVGCSFVWNQLMQNGNFATGDLTGWQYAGSATKSVSNGVLTIVSSAINAIYQDIVPLPGHKYILSARLSCVSSTPSVFFGFYKGNSSYVPINAPVGLSPTVFSGMVAMPGDLDTSATYTIRIRINNSAETTLTAENVFCIDLTQLFGSTAIADYIYNLEQATAGAGIAKLKELGFFTEDYYAYDAGSIQSVDIKEYSVTGKNLVEGVISGYYIASNGLFNSNANYDMQIARVIQGQTYTVTSNEGLVAGFFTKKPTAISQTYDGARVDVSNKTFVAPIDGYIAFRTAKDYATPQCEIGTQATAYEPYHKTTYSLTPTELRGVPKIDANNNIYCDGDEYASDGGHTEKYDISDLGTLTWKKTTYGQSGTVFFYAASSIPNCGADGGLGVKPSNIICSQYLPKSRSNIYAGTDNGIDVEAIGETTGTIYIFDANKVNMSAEDFKTAMSGVYLVYKKDTPTTETLTPFDYPQSVGSLEEIVDYKVEQEQRDVAIPTGHVTEYMGKGGEFTLPTLPETPSVLAYDGHNFFWKPETA